MYVGITVRTKKIICLVVVVLTISYFYLKRNSGNLQNEKLVSLKSLLIGAIVAAEFGGLEVLSVHEKLKINVESKGKTKEGINDPVTAADYRSHCVMYYSLIREFPDITIISEEISKDCDKVNIPDISAKLKANKKENHEPEADDLVDPKEITVWIDPLDATKEFTENLLQYVTTMVCVSVKGVPVIGVIYKPFETRKSYSLYWTWTSHGSSPNLKNLPKADSDRAPVLIVSRSHPGKIENASKIAFGDNVDIVTAAGAGYKFLEVAVGNVTAYVHMTTIKKWDICAGAAILSALGGRITTLYQQQPISFGPTDSKVVSAGLLATMSNYKWYLDKFSNI